jgi:hypothetical protein
LSRKTLKLKSHIIFISSNYDLIKKRQPFWINFEAVFGDFLGSFEGVFGEVSVLYLVLFRVYFKVMISS